MFKHWNQLCEHCHYVCNFWCITVKISTTRKRKKESNCDYWNSYEKRSRGQTDSTLEKVHALHVTHSALILNIPYSLITAKCISEPDIKPEHCQVGNPPTRKKKRKKEKRKVILFSVPVLGYLTGAMQIQ